MIYEPREDSFLIEKEVIKFAKGKRFLDMGTGSGILGKAAMRSGATEVVFADINPEVISQLQKEGLDVVRTNLFSKIRGKFGLISFNPPYLPEDAREDKNSALATTGGKEGDEIICKFIKDAPAHLLKDGKILLLLSSLTPLQRFDALCKEKKFTYTKIATEKFDFEEIFVLLLERE